MPSLMRSFPRTSWYGIQDDRSVSAEEGRMFLGLSVIITEFDVDINKKDIPILGGAIANKATYLLTGDKKDFGELWGREVQGVKIVSPRMLAEELVEKRNY